MSSGFRIVSGYDVPPFPPPSGEFGIACDIGTTTVVMELVGPMGVIARESFLNSQRRWGADVISRIRAAGLGRSGELRSLICGDLASGLDRLFSAAAVHASDAFSDVAAFTACTVAGNTAMCHFLLGLPSEGLGVAPFTPAMTVYPELALGELLGEELSSVSVPRRFSANLSACPVRIVPGVSAFIGGDIVAGLAALGFGAPAPAGSNAAGSGGPELFLDLGTNAEMALAVGGTFFCASAAAGPAFEGGSISCGTGSVPGAVASVRREGSRFAYDLIGGDGGDSGIAESGDSGSSRASAGPTGLCGSGLLDFLACALEAGLVSADGAIAPVCAESGILLSPGSRIALTAGDVRELQLAKAAIRAGLGTLLEVAGVAEKDVVKVHLAGGFGLYLNEESALAVGLLPRAFRGRIHRAGNTSLAGAARWLSDPSLKSRFNAILNSSRPVQLADEPAFGRRFIDSMEFS
jgi:uncharacterized 2Fe-2S/4Fe-4S cluster protein (DUF4445 family)